MIKALKIQMLCACRGGGGAERVKPLIRVPAPDRGLLSCETLRWGFAVDNRAAGMELPAERSGPGVRQ
jgi:hypothetical protein